MTETSPNQIIQATVDHLRDRLDGIISERLKRELHGLPWTAVLAELDRAKGFVPKVYDRTDLQAQLRMLTERLGGLKFPFDDENRTVSILGGELRIVRNGWAHGKEFSWLDVWRATDFQVRLLTHFGDSEGLARAEELQRDALKRVVADSGLAPVAPAAAPVEALATETVVALEDSESVRPDAEMLDRGESASTPTIGTQRLPFEPWVPVPVGDVSVLDELPKKASKEQVRAVASEIVEIEGPIHIDRLVRSTALAFGLRRLHQARSQKIARQVKAAGLSVDSHKTVWPSTIDPSAWAQFRPNTSDVDRDFVEISPIEIANAATFIVAKRGRVAADALATAVLQTFGRKRRTQQFMKHLDIAIGLAIDRGGIARDGSEFVADE